MVLGCDITISSKANRPVSPGYINGGNIMGTKLVRSNRDKKIMGVCGGIAEYLHIDSTLVRIIWAIAVCCFGSGILLYIIAGLIMPEGPIGSYNDYYNNNYNDNYNNNYNNNYYNTDYYSPTDNTNSHGSYTYDANYNSNTKRYEVTNNNPNNR